jgi:hypothetical protein
MHPITRQHGYVLVVTLVLVMIAAMATVSASRLALANARESIEAERSLQRRWGNLSIERSLLPAAEQVLVDEEKRQREAQVSCRRRVLLGQMSFELVIADEQAKPNVNAVVASHERSDAETQLRQMLSGIVPASRVLLRLSSASSPQTPVASFGQIFDSFAPQELLESRLGMICPASALTCWGDRRLNVYRASADSMRRGLSILVGVGDAEQIVRLRAKSEHSVLGNLLARLELTGPQRQRLASMVTDHSDCHSLWIISSETGYASRYRFCVQSRAGRLGANVAMFEW